MNGRPLSESRKGAANDFFWGSHARLCRSIVLGRADDRVGTLSYPAPVFPIRRLLAERYLAALICAAALLIRVIVPTGYMIGTDHGRFSVTICSGITDKTMAMAMPGMSSAMPDHDKNGHGKAETPCAFAGLAAPALGGTDPILIVALVAFVMAAGLLPTALPTVFQRAYDRPPLRGPPAYL